MTKLILKVNQKKDQVNDYESYPPSKQYKETIGILLSL